MNPTAAGPHVPSLSRHVTGVACTDALRVPTSGLSQKGRVDGVASSCCTPTLVAFLVRIRVFCGLVSGVARESRSVASLQIPRN